MKITVDKYYERFINPNRVNQKEEVQEWRNIEELNERMDEKIDRFQAEEGLKFYPGSAKGPEPKDDPLSFMDWYEENMPEEMQDVYMNELDEEAEFKEFQTDKFMNEYKDRMNLVQHEQYEDVEDDSNLKHNFA